MTEDISNNGQEADSAEKARGRPFQPGQSGNPSGRPKGARNKLTADMLNRVEVEWEPIFYKLIEKATKGDVGALRLFFLRLFPQRHSQPVEFDLPPIKAAEDVPNASSAVLAACADGNLSPSEAQEIMSLIATHVRLLESSTLEARLSAVEKQLKP